MLAALAAAAALAVHPAPAMAQPAVRVDRRAYRTALAAYRYAYAPLLHRLSQRTFPVDQLVGVAALSTPADRLVVRPNVDTAYTVGRLDLRGGPVILHVPAVRHRYYGFQLMDAYTNVVGYVGSRTTGHRAGDYAIVGPRWVGSLPAHVTPIASPTNDALLLGRTLVRWPGELPRVERILGRYALGRAGGPLKPSLVLDQRPATPRPTLPHGLGFFDAVGVMLAADPPPERDGAALRRFARIGIGPGRTPSTESLPPGVRAALALAAQRGQRRIAAFGRRAERRSARHHHGWLVSDPRTGAYGTHYRWRAFIAQSALWANTPAEAMYPLAARDAHGRPLSGRHRYVLRFPPHRLPPARAFWSLTMYDRHGLLVANRLHRYALGDHSLTTTRDRDGGLRILLSHRRPCRLRGNWLPAPRGRFSVMLRLYAPRRAALRGRWQPPGIRRVRAR